MMRQMIRWNKSGEVQVIDADVRVASAFLHHSERNAPLNDYELDIEFDPEVDGDYTVIREAEVSE